MDSLLGDHMQDHVKVMSNDFQGFLDACLGKIDPITKQHTFVSMYAIWGGEAWVWVESNECAFIFN